MIQFFHLENFKCFTSLDVDFRGMTVFAGANGSGKSSIIQALLLLRQTHDDKSENLSSAFVLKGDYVNLISANAVRNFMSEREDVVLEIKEDGVAEVRFTMLDMVRDDVIARPIVEGPLSDFIANSNLLSDDFVYLYADRQMPQVDYDIKERELVGTSRLGDKHGNWTAAYLNECANVQNINIEILKHKDAENLTVVSNVAAWMQYIMDYSLTVKAEMSPNGKRIDLSYMANIAGSEVKLSPLNVAFGNSYLLPVVVGILTAPAGSLFIVENPEAHLHPRAQIRVAELLARAAQAGVQVIVETHSDHFLNAIRYSVYKGRVQPSNVVAYYKDTIEDDFKRIEYGISGEYVGEGFPDGFYDASLGMLTEMQ